MGIKEIINRVKISIKAGETKTIDLTEPFNINDSMFSIIHMNYDGNIKIKISNANGKSIENTFRATPLIPVIIAFKPFEGRDEINNEDYFAVEITPVNNLEGEFSFGKGYPKDYIRLFSR